MGPGDNFFSSINLLYLLGAGYTVYQLSRFWRIFKEPVLTPNARQVAAMVAFFLLVPLGVLLHEFGHIAAAWSTGSRVLGLHYFIYWGFVEYIPASRSPLLEWYVSLAGNALTYILGILCLVAAVAWKSGKPAVRVMLAQLGVLELAQTLIFYPLISLDPGFDGDWDTIYSFAAPFASALTAVIHALSLVAFVLVLQRNRAAKWLLSG